MIVRVAAALALICGLMPFQSASAQHAADGRARAREIGVEVGVLPTGPLNAITDVEGVKVGHVTLVEGLSVVVREEFPTA